MVPGGVPGVSPGGVAPPLEPSPGFPPPPAAPSLFETCDAHAAKKMKPIAPSSWPRMKRRYSSFRAGVEGVSHAIFGAFGRCGMRQGDVVLQPAYQQSMVHRRCDVAVVAAPSHTHDIVPVCPLPHA